MYFGSVRFFKNLILAVVLVAIGVPSYLAYSYHRTLQTLSETAEISQDDPHAIQNTQEESITIEAPAYQELYPDFYAPQPLQANTITPQTIYLTFDDGPSPCTDQILSALAQTNVKATFFVIGVSKEEDLQRLRNIAEQGHTLAMHSYSHNYKQIYSSVEAYLEDMYRVFRMIQDTTGQTPTAFRFPGGSINGYNATIYQELISEMLRRGFVPYDWNLSSEDATGTKFTPATLAENVTKKASGMVRGFVLMHDSATKTTTAQALPQVIQSLQSKGFQFAPITPEVSPLLFGYTE